MILEALAVLGIGNSFIFKTEPTDEEMSVFNHPASEVQDEGVATEATVTVANEVSTDAQESVKEELEVGPTDIADPLIIKEETENVEEAFEGITVGKLFHNVEPSLSTSCKVHWQHSETIKNNQVKITNLKVREKLGLVEIGAKAPDQIIHVNVGLLKC